MTGNESKNDDDINSKHKKSFVVSNGFQKMIFYLQEHDIYVEDPLLPRLERKLKLNYQRRGFDDFNDYLSFLKKSPEESNFLFSWLRKALVFDNKTKTFNYLVYSKKNKYKTPREVPTLDQFLLIKEPTDTENLEKVLDYLTTKGVNWQAYKRKYFIRRLNIRLRKNKLSSFSEYLKLLHKVPSEINNIIDNLSINVTHFLRDKSVYRFIEDNILPKLFSTNNKINIWSAGCAVGSEPYSIAFIIYDKLGQKAFDKTTILATDINNQLLTQAKLGVYSHEYMKELTSNEIAKYFIKEGDTFKVKPFLKKAIHFKHHDLRMEPPKATFQLIFCRNVLIYFSREEAIKLFNKLHSVLDEKGFLVLGRSELISSTGTKLFKPIDRKNRIYTKVTNQK